MSRDGVIRSSKRVIRVTPTLNAAEHHVGDVLCTQVEIPRAVIEKGGIASLKTVYMVDYGNEDTDVDYTIIFTEKGTTEFGSQNATADISDADLVIQKITSFGKVIGTEATTGTVDQVRIHQMIPPSISGESVSDFCLIKADEGSTSVYFHCILTAVDATTNPTFTANQLEFIFHIED
tara:strand:+ start:1246 stop:1779 length:534 start_codon:yes stop_codon:yes gene_type:complete